MHKVNKPDCSTNYVSATLASAAPALHHPDPPADCFSDQEQLSQLYNLPPAAPDLSCDVRTPPAWETVRVPISGYLS